MSVGMRIIAGLGRMLVSIIFILLGLAVVFNWEVVEHDFSGALANWEYYVGHYEYMNEIVTRASRMVPLLITIGAGCQVLGGFLVFLGMRARLGAILLLIYLIPTTVLFHHFWFLEGHAMTRSLVLFLKNLAIIGGLLMIVAMGAGIPSRGEVKKDKKDNES